MTPNQIRALVASKDYIALAATFAGQVDTLVGLPGAAAERDTVRALANRLAEVLKAGDNRRFNTALFLKACGIDRLKER